MTEETHTSEYFATRFTYNPQRKAVWKEIVAYIDRDIASHDSFLELGPGYCDFINQVRAEKKYAVDADAIVNQYADNGIETHVGNCCDLSHLDDHSIANVFASNLLEHLTREDLEKLMAELARVLLPNGRILIIQPNYRLCSANYFDDYTHVSIFSDVSLCDFLEAHGFRVLKSIPGLLPFSMKPKVPKHPFLVRMYLRSPIRPLAKQMYIVAERTA